MKFLIFGLGNIGEEYAGTRHNVGFEVIDFLINKYKISFQETKFSFYSTTSIKGREIFLIKPTTFMNLSGNCVKFWLDKHKVDLSQILVICDDVNLPLGRIRLRPSGSDGGHNGLSHIIEVLGNSDFPRLRIGIDKNYPKGQQAKYVLSKFTAEQLPIISKSIEIAANAVETFVFEGINSAMNKFNKNHYGPTTSSN